MLDLVDERIFKVNRRQNMYSFSTEDQRLHVNPSTEGRGGEERESGVGQHPLH